MTKWRHYLRKVREMRDANPDWREGQAYFNVLESMEPALAGEVRNTEADPFYTDGRLDKFRQWVSEKLP